MGAVALASSLANVCELVGFMQAKVRQTTAAKHHTRTTSCNVFRSHPDIFKPFAHFSPNEHS
jgi:hypothetical protein